MTGDEGVGGRLRAVARRLAGPARPADGPAGAALTPREQLLLGSRLLDTDWYAEQADLPAADRPALVRHYLEVGSAAGLSPHPLVEPRLLAAGLGRRLPEGQDPLVAYLRQQAWRLRPHPLFDARAYLDEHPEAAEHPDGPVGHHDEGGASELASWVGDRWREWRARADEAAAEEPVTELPDGWAAPEDGEVDPADRVSVVLDAGLDATALSVALASLADQRVPGGIQVVVLDRGWPDGPDGLRGAVGAALPAADLLLVPAPEERRSDAFAEALAAADGTWVAFLAAGDAWAPGRLAGLTRTGADLVTDGLEMVDADGVPRWSLHAPGPVRTRQAPDPARLLVRRALLDTLTDPLPGLRGAWDLDLVARLLAVTHADRVAQVGVRRDEGVRRGALAGPEADRPGVEHEWLPAWRDVVLGRRLVDWAGLAEQPGEPGLVSVVVPTYDDWRLTSAAVASVAASAGVGGLDVECVVWDNGSSAATSAALDDLARRHPGVVVVHSATNHGFALGNDLALAHTRGDTIVFLNNDTTVPPDWLPPVVAALADPEVLGVQPLLLYPTGTVQSAGVVFPPGGALPHALLRGFPVEDAAGLADAPLAALTGAALALRRSDALALGGFDPVFTNGMEDVDLCQRLAASRPGVFRVLPDVRVVHHESRTPGRYARHLDNRRVWLERWQATPTPADDDVLWARCGYDVVDRVPAPARNVEDRRLLPLDPVLVRRRLAVDEPEPRLRWALKSSAPAGPGGEVWGDTHFARSLAAALRERGQEVVIDARPEQERTSGHHDDVVLVLRGLARYHPAPGQVSLLWVISHPDLVERAEASSYDAVLSAGPGWAERARRAWGLPVETLLQATDPALFAPGRAEPDSGERVLFVGNSRRVYRPVVRDAVAAGLPVGVHGGLWDSFLPPGHWRGPGIANADLGAAYSSAGVVLNDHWDDMRTGGFVSNRLFDAVASGARVVTDDVAGLGDLLAPSVQIYRDPADLARLCTLPDPDAVFGTTEERHALAERVRREHSFAARADRLLEIALAARAGLAGRPVTP